ncbi:MAG: molybdate ABC transporter substrate-binding protein [Bacteroidota bacterium]
MCHPKVFIYVLIVATIAVLSGCTGKKRKDRLTIATAANVQFAMEELINAFEVETGITCEMIVGSSGKLTAQIKNGAPYDVFLSADMKYPQSLEEAGLTIGGAEIYARGELVIWSQVPDLTPSLELLASTEIKHIALANPKVAPYGKAAMAVIKQVDDEGSLSDKLVYGESISQVNQFVLSKVCEIGFTSKSSVLSAKEQGRWSPLPSANYPPVNQGVVIVQHDNQDMEKNANQFVRFLKSNKGAGILSVHGYIIP